MLRYIDLYTEDIELGYDDEDFEVSDEPIEYD